MEEEKQQSSFHTCENMIYKSTISTGLLSTIYTILGPKKIAVEEAAAAEAARIEAVEADKIEKAVEAARNEQAVETWRSC